MPRRGLSSGRGDRSSKGVAETENNGPDLQFNDLPVAVACRETLLKGFKAVHLCLSPT